MALPWVRLDTGMPRNHKILSLLDQKDGFRAAFTYTCALAFSGEQGTGGFIPRSALPFIHARPAEINKLVEARLLDPHDQGGGWDIHDWAEFQPTTEEHAKRSQRAKDAAAIRWAKQNKAKS